MNSGQQQHIFEDWLATHRGLFFKIVRAYAFTHHDQEDLFQVIATQVWNSVPSYRGESKTSTWIYRVALFAAISWSKKERRHRDRHQDLDGATPDLLAVSPRRNPRVGIHASSGCMSKSVNSTKSSAR
jgi:RNA polymerase sigma-70 factor, ECF subfamily